MSVKTVTDVWNALQVEAQSLINGEPLLSNFFQTTITSHSSLRSALSYLLAEKLADDVVPADAMRKIFEVAYSADPGLIDAACADLLAVYTRDAAANDYSTVLLYFKGFHALQSYRVANHMWSNGRASLATYLQSRISSTLQVDIHPAAKIGKGVMFDHATGIVVGETCIIEDEVSILQSVTLGGTGKESGDRHPKIRAGVLIGAGAKILGNIEVGKGAKVGANSVVLDPVLPHTTVAGVPAKVVGCAISDKPALDMDQGLTPTEGS